MGPGFPLFFLTTNAETAPFFNGQMGFPRVLPSFFCDFQWTNAEIAPFLCIRTRNEGKPGRVTTPSMPVMSHWLSNTWVTKGSTQCGTLHDRVMRPARRLSVQSAGYQLHTQEIYRCLRPLPAISTMTSLLLLLSTIRCCL